MLVFRRVLILTQLSTASFREAPLFRSLWIGHGSGALIVTKR